MTRLLAVIAVAPVTAAVWRVDEQAQRQDSLNVESGGSLPFQTWFNRSEVGTSALGEAESFRAESAEAQVLNDGGVWHRMKESAKTTVNGLNVTLGHFKIPNVGDAKRAINEIKEFADSSFNAAIDHFSSHTAPPIEAPEPKKKKHAVTPELCQPERDLSFFKATTIYSNLGGLGPNSTSPQSMRFANVFFDSGMHADMLVTATTKYVGTPVGKNTLQEDFMVVNVNSGSSVTLSVAFVDRIASPLVPVEVPAFLFTVGGLSHDEHGGGEMSVTFDGVSDIYPADEGEVSIRTETKKKRTIISSKPWGNGSHAASQDTLLRARNMSPRQQTKAVTLRMPRLSRFEMTLAVSAGSSSRDFYFAGASNVVCKPKASCSSFSCPAFFVRKPFPERLLCQDQECAELDTTTCCAPITPKDCHPKRTLVVSASNLVYSNLAGLGPDLGMPKSLFFSDVFPHSDEHKLDLEVTAENTYSAVDVHMNKIAHADFGSVNIAPGTSVDLRFSFFQHGKRIPAAPASAFYLSFNAFDVQKGLGVDQVRVFQSDVLGEFVPNLSVNRSVDALNRTLFMTAVDAVDVALDGTPEVSLLLAKKATYLFTVSAPSADEGQTFRFSGYSTTGCPPVTSLCEHTACPGGHQKRIDALERRCAHDVCTLEDTGICCEPSAEAVCDARNLVKFLPDSLLESNLGGMGPHKDAPQHMLISDILPESDQRVNLRVTAVGKYWMHKQFDNANGLTNSFLKIDVEAGHKVRLKLEFLDAVTAKPVTLPMFYLTVADVNKGHSHFSVEAVGLAGHDYVNMSKGTSLRHSSSTQFGKTWETFSASELGDEHELPALKLSPSQTSNSVGAMYHTVSEIEVVLEVSEAQTHNMTAQPPRAFYISGQTSLICPVHRATCENFVCPAKQILRRNAHSLSCADSSCTDNDAATCCRPSNEDQCRHERSMILSAHSLAHSNLCDKGPDTGKAALIYSDVFPGSGKRINLEVSSRHGCDVYDPSRNGLDGSIGTVSIQAGATLNLDFQLVDQQTGDLVEGMWPYIMTFLDMDAPDDQGGSGFIEVAVSNLVEYQVTDRTTLRIDNGTFRSTAKASNDRPSHANALMPRHLAKSVALKLGKPEFSLVAFVSGGFHGGHELRFAGSSNLACPTLAFCSSFKCPAGYAHRSTANTTTCLGAFCTTMDTHVCCVRQECAAERSLQIRPGHIRHSNLGGLGPDTSATDNAIVFADVFPQSGQEVDLAVTTTGPYYQQSADLNGVDGPFGRINMAPGTDVTLNFQFVEPGTMVRASVEPFFFSVFNVAMPSDDRKKMINVSSYEWYALTQRSKLIREHRGDMEFFVSIADQDDWRLKSSPSHPLALGATQLNHTVSFMMPAKSEFTLTASVAAGWLGQNLLFAGPSSVICGGQALCNTHTCPVGTSLKMDASRMVCKGPRCNNLDTEVCCDTKITPAIQEQEASGAPRRSEWAIDEDVVDQNNMG